MSARSNASPVVYLPSIVDENFLLYVSEQLERLRSESEVRGHSLLASLLSIAKGEAEDDLMTYGKTKSVQLRAASLSERDDGVTKMAQKFAFAKRKAANEDWSGPSGDVPSVLRRRG